MPLSRVGAPGPIATATIAAAIVSAAGAGLAGCAPAAAPSSPAARPPAGRGAPPVRAARLPRDMDGRLAELVERGDLPGVVLLVVWGDSVVHVTSHGVTEVGGATPMTPDVVLRAAPVTPLVHGLAAAALAHGGRLALDAPVGDWVPDLLDPVGAVTMAQLLTHTSGLAREFVRGPVTADDLHVAARWLTPLDVVAPPGALVTASSTAPILAADALQRAGGRPYARVVADAVFAPLGMTRSTLEAEAAAALGLGPGYGYVDDDPRQGFGPLPPPADSVIRRPSRGLHASPRDLARLAAALLAGGVVDGERRIPPRWWTPRWRPGSASRSPSGRQRGTPSGAGWWSGKGGRRCG